MDSRKELLFSVLMDLTDYLQALERSGDLSSSDARILIERSETALRLAGWREGWKY